jgi:hypothetical protein
MDINVAFWNLGNLFDAVQVRDDLVVMRLSIFISPFY